MNQMLPHAMQGNAPDVADDDSPFLLPSAESPRRREDFPGILHDDLRDDIDYLTALATERGLETLVLDHTRQDVGLHVARVVVPGLLPLPARLAPGRLYDVPVKRGWITRAPLENDLNPRQMDPADAKAYELYLQGRYFLHRMSPENLVKAIQLFDRAIDAAPGYARAYAGLSSCQLYQAHYGFIPPDDGFTKAWRNAVLSIELDDQLPESHTSLGCVRFMYEMDWAGAEESFSRALAIDTNSVDAHVHCSHWFLCVPHDFDSAIYHVLRAVEIDPLSPAVNTSAGPVLSMAGRLEESLGYFDRALDIDPTFPMVRLSRAMAWSAMGRHDEAIGQLRGSIWSQALLGQAYTIAGRVNEALEIAGELSRPDSPLRARLSEIALLWLSVGERGEAAPWLDRVVAARDYMLALMVAPAWLPYRNDPLVRQVLNRMGLGSFESRKVESHAAPGLEAV